MPNNSQWWMRRSRRTARIRGANLSENAASARPRVTTEPYAQVSFVGESPSLAQA
jgi:hypothetical protein